MGLIADTDALTFTTDDKNGTPKGIDLPSLRAALNKKLLDAKILAKDIKSRCTTSGTVSAVDAIYTAL